MRLFLFGHVANRLQADCSYHRLACMVQQQLRFLSGMKCQGFTTDFEQMWQPVLPLPTLPGAVRCSATCYCDSCCIHFQERLLHVRCTRPFADTNRHLDSCACA